MMSDSSWTSADTIKAKQIWSFYQSTHDLSGLADRFVGIDPRSEQIWFGDSIEEIVRQRNSDGYSFSLYYARVGWKTVYWKG